MFRQFYVAATGMDSLEKDLVTITNNVANVKTTGYKKSRVEFETLFPEVLQEAIEDADQETKKPPVELGSGVKIAGVPKDFSQGTIEITNNPLDVAIQGEGFYQFMMPDGTIAYSRAGNLQKNSEGKLVNAAGYPLEPQIVIPENATNITISTDGKVYVQENNDPVQNEIGQIELVKFINPAGLKSVGDNLYMQTVASGEPVRGVATEEGFGQIAQFSLENSNVNIIQEMMRMIMTQRSFDVISKAIQSGEQMLNSAIEVAKG